MRDAFIQRATSYRPSGDARITVDSVTVDGDTAVVRLSRTYGGGGLFDGGRVCPPHRAPGPRERGLEDHRAARPLLDRETAPVSVVRRLYFLLASPSPAW